MQSSARESGFTLVEVSVAASLVVAFALAFATSFGVAFGATRGNLLRQQAVGVLSEELEYVRAISWSELAMTEVETTAPMLDESGAELDGTSAGFAGSELLVSDASGVITPWRTYSRDGQEYLVWRYVTHVDGGLRRFVALVMWSEDGASESLLGSTLVSEVTGRANEGGVSTSAPGTPPTSSPTTTSTTTTTLPPTTTTSTATTTTTLPPTSTTVAGGTQMVIDGFTLELNRSAGKQTAGLDVRTTTGSAVGGATVYGIWSTTPAEEGYPLVVTQDTISSGRATFVHNDGHPTGTVVQFCVTSIVKSGYYYSGGTQCVTATW